MGNKQILPPRFFMSALVLVLIIHFIIPRVELIPYPWNWLGLLPAAFGIWLNLAADGLFKKAETTVKPFEKSSALVDKGPFAITRNPMYVGMLAIVLGECVVLGSALPFAIPVALFFIFRNYYIIIEEKMLEEKFGSDFLNYRKKVRRWL